ncbi:MAG: hypothetical protein Kow0062_04830 [Acidobacteriota bacterium]|nr:MAG: XRE family transcriptional regulator [Acidobacteriota bacterium]
MEFRELIRTRREAAGWTKKRLAELVGVTQPYIVQIENDGKVPSDAVVQRLADVLGLDRRELLFAAYRARVPLDADGRPDRSYDDLLPSNDYDQPFVPGRGSHLESPDFIVRDLGTSVGGGFQVSLVETKTDNARLAEHRHPVTVTMVAIAGTFEVELPDRTVTLDPENEVSVTIRAGVPHTVTARGLGKFITVSLAPQPTGERPAARRAAPHPEI